MDVKTPKPELSLSEPKLKDSEPKSAKIAPHVLAKIQQAMLRIDYNKLMVEHEILKEAVRLELKGRTELDITNGTITEVTNHAKTEG